MDYDYHDMFDNAGRGWEQSEYVQSLSALPMSADDRRIAVRVGRGDTMTAAFWQNYDTERFAALNRSDAARAEDWLRSADAESEHDARSLIVTATHDVGDCADCDRLRTVLADVTVETCAQIPDVACVAFATAIGPDDVGQLS